MSARAQRNQANNPANNQLNAANRPPPPQQQQEQSREELERIVEHRGELLQQQEQQNQALQNEIERLQREVEELRQANAAGNEREREIDELREANTALERKLRSKVNKAKLPMQNLTTQTPNVGRWIERYEALADRHEFNEQEKLDHLAVYVDPEIANLILEHGQADWTEMKRVLVQELEERNANQLQSQLRREYDWKMDVKAYVSDKMAAGKKLGLTRERIMQAISEGLPADLRWIERENQLETLYVLIRQRKELYRKNHQAHPATMQVKRPFEANSKQGGSYSGGYSGGQSNGYGDKRYKRGPNDRDYCFKCKDEQRGFVYGHIAKNCPFNKGSEVPKSGKKVNNLEKRDDEVCDESCELIYFSVRLNGVDCTALYDPGAAISALDRNLAHRIGINVVDRTVAINGGQIGCSGVAIVKLRIHEITKLVMLYVIDYVNLKGKVLIGLNCLREFGLTHNRNFEIVNFENTFKIPTSVSESVEKINLKELNFVLNNLELEAKADCDLRESDFEIERAINHIIVNDVDPLELAINPDLDEATKKRILAVMRKYDVFAKDKYDTGLIEGFECSFDTVDNIPVHLRPYKMNYRDECAMEAIIDEWIKRGIVRESRSGWASPALLVNKRSEGKARLVVNYGAVNKKCPKVNQPAPNMNRLFDRFRDKVWKAKFDIKNAFLHMRMREEDIEKSAFVTQRRLLSCIFPVCDLCDFKATSD